MIRSYYDPPDHLEGSEPMRGDDPRHESMFSYVTPEARVRADHPLRPIRRMTDAVLARLSPRFDRLYSMCFVFVQGSDRLKFRNQVAHALATI